jgi:predicted dithiol-disulfide oxidoreductase (DUF899 family)
MEKIQETIQEGGRNRVVSRNEWLASRKEFLSKEKQLTRLRDRLSAERRGLPWVKIEEKYVFDGPDGKVSLADLFQGRSQLVIQHFMFGPGWKEGCVGCSFQADHVAGAFMHLQHHDVSFAAVSRAPIGELEAFRQRMGWQFTWVSSYGNSFNFDFNVSATDEEKIKGKQFYNFEEQDFVEDELPGMSFFYKNEYGEIFHTYSAYARGVEHLVGAYNYLDMTPKGRNETEGGNLTNWVRHHDKYDAPGHVDRSGRFRAEEESGSCCKSEGKS